MTQNILILDLETQLCAEDCVWCYCSKDAHDVDTARCLRTDKDRQYSPIGWKNYGTLGISIGCTWDCQAGTPTFFDRENYLTLLEHLDATRPLLVTFNGKTFDVPLLMGLYVYDYSEAERGNPLAYLQDDSLHHYDILDEIWKIDHEGKAIRGLNSLGALAAANGLTPKAMDGATAPLLWSQGRYADVINYCLGDVLLTKALFELVLARQPIKRAGGRDVLLPHPFSQERRATARPPDSTSVHSALAREDSLVPSVPIAPGAGVAASHNP